MCSASTIWLAPTLFKAISNNSNACFNVLLPFTWIATGYVSLVSDKSLTLYLVFSNSFGSNAKHKVMNFLESFNTATLFLPKLIVSLITWHYYKTD